MERWEETVKLITLIILTLVTFPVSAQLYKWKDEKGRWQFTDTPPPEANTQKTNISNRSSSRSGTESQAQSEGVRLQMEGAAREGKVLIGMNRDQVKRALGDPASTDLSAGPDGQVEMWGYRNAEEGKPRQIIFENGAVTRIVTGPALPSQPAAGTISQAAGSAPASSASSAASPNNSSACDSYKRHLNDIAQEERDGYSDSRGEQLRQDKARFRQLMRDNNCR
jgi:hypothetical protein